MLILRENWKIFGLMQRLGISASLLLIMGFLPFPAEGQSVIVLDSCGVSYVDPQEGLGGNDQERDTLIYSTYFTEEENLLRVYYIDINAFGGQQVDRAEAYAIMPDSSRKFLGGLAFGVCSDCVEGFALIDNGVLLVSGVGDKNTMDLWLESLSQPDYALPGNLQTLRGVGRISGQLPVCAKGLFIEYVISSNPQSTSTQFSTHIICPEVIATCAIGKDYRIDCEKDSIYLEATFPAACFSEPLQVSWSDERGRVVAGASAAFPRDGYQGKYYLTIADDCCTVIDSLELDFPVFAEAGSDVQACAGSPVLLQGMGGVSQFWERPDGSRVDGVTVDIAAVGIADGGFYVFHAANEQNCTDTDTLELSVLSPPRPDVSIAPACLGDTVALVTLNDSLYTNLTWYDPAGRPLPEAQIPGLQPDDIGLYRLEAVDAFGCQISETFEVTGSEPPDFEVLIEETCESSTVFLFPGTYFYQWEGGRTGSPFTVTTGGDYGLTVTDAAGCSSATTINIPPPDGPDVEVEVTQPPCPNDFGSIRILPEDESEPLIFSIDGGETYSLSARFEKLPPGQYSVVVQDALGCLLEYPVQIVAPDTMGVELGLEELLVRPNTPVHLTARTVGNVQEYQWVPQEIDSGLPETDFVANQDLDIRIIVRDGRGCIGSDGFQLTIVLGNIYVPNAFSPNGDGINDRFTFFSDNGSGEVIESLQIFDRWGNNLFGTSEISLNVEALGWDGTFKGRLMDAGVYTYYGVVRFGNGVTKVLKGDVALVR